MRMPRRMQNLLPEINRIRIDLLLLGFRTGHQALFGGVGAFGSEGAFVGLEDDFGFVGAFVDAEVVVVGACEHVPVHEIES